MKIIKHQEIWENALISDWEAKDFYTGDTGDEEFQSIVKSIEARHSFSEQIQARENQINNQEVQERDEIKRQILEEARVQAEKILEDAKVQCDIVRGQAFSQGLAESAVEAEKRAQEKYRVLYEQEVLKIQALIAQVSAAYPEAIKKTQDGLVKLALEIVKKIIKDEGTNRKEVVLSMAQEGLIRAQNKAYIRLRVNPMQLPIIHEKKEEFLTRFHDIKNFEIVGDVEVFPGGCIVDTNSGSIDLRLDKQFSVMKEHISAEGQNDESF